MFLSEKNRASAGGEMHANFKLKLSGGALRLYNADVLMQSLSAS